MTKRYTHAILYVGAPYDNNGRDGHIVSRHISRAHAERAFERRFTVIEYWDGNRVKLEAADARNHVIREIG